MNLTIPLEIYRVTLGALIYKFFTQTHYYWQADPRPPLYYYPFWFLLKVTWEIFSLKRSHFFTWIKDSHDSQEILSSGVTNQVPPNLKARTRSSGWKNFWLTNFGWQRVAIVRPKDKGIKKYQVGIIREYDGKVMFCSLVVMGRCALLQAPQPVKIFGISYPEKKLIKLEVVQKNFSKWQLKEIPLL